MKTCARWILIVLLAAAAVFSGEEAKAAERTYVRSYPLLSSDVELMTQAIKELVGLKRSILYNKADNSLIVTGTTEEHQQIGLIMQEINVPSPNVRIDVKTTTVGTSRDASAGVKGSGNVVITKDGAKTKYTFKGHARNQLSGRSGMTQQTLVVQSGKEASLEVSTEVPFYEYLIWYGTNNWQMTIEQDMIREKVGAFLVAQPTVIGRGPMVNITLTPEIRELVGEKRRRIRFSKVATTVTARDGETITIGGLGEAQEFFDKFLVGASSGGETKSMSVTLTPHIMKGFGAPARQ